ncbi:MAG TPA: ComF family protein [Candidatus Moranbacteria bacterium]|nr:ComF family protein [Candidatus Moranbacteria bacterium]
MPSRLFTIFRKIHTFVLNILFPIKCVSCSKEGQWLCDGCFSKIKLQTDHVCGVCEKMIVPDGRTCQSCKKKSALSALVVAASYKNDLVAQLVHYYKYRFVSDLHIDLGKIIISALQKTDLPLPDVVIPIPLHKRRLRWRGFNQSALLAKYVAQNLLPQNPIQCQEDILIRKKYTLPQMKIKNYQNRRENMQDAFLASNQQDISGKSVLLIDDIATTGSTIFECAKVLKKAGVKEIYAAVIARQEMKK